MWQEAEWINWLLTTLIAAPFVLYLASKLKKKPN